MADEHLATAITRRVLASLQQPRHSLSPGHRPTIVFATPEDEHHELGLMMAAEVLQHAGYKTIYLGADVPVAALATAALKHDAGLLCLSITMQLQAATLERTLDVVAQACPGVQVFVGGQGLSPALLDDCQLTRRRTHDHLRGSSPDYWTGDIPLQPGGPIGQRRGTQVLS